MDLLLSKKNAGARKEWLEKRGKIVSILGRSVCQPVSLSQGDVCGDKTLTPHVHGQTDMHLFAF